MFLGSVSLICTPSKTKLQLQELPQINCLKVNILVFKKLICRKLVRYSRSV